jgi:hypothetical protein
LKLIDGRIPGRAATHIRSVEDHKVEEVEGARFSPVRLPLRQLSFGVAYGHIDDT